jgi:hypothetical protein
MQSGPRGYWSVVVDGAGIDDDHGYLLATDWSVDRPVDPEGLETSPSANTTVVEGPDGDPCRGEPAPRDGRR